MSIKNKCKNGHDLSDPKSRASGSNCRICRKARESTLRYKYLRVKRNLRYKINCKRKRIKELEEFLNAQEDTYRDGTASCI